MAPQYPNAPGFKENSTSRLAARKIQRSGRATTLREMVLAYFDAGHKATAEEVAEALGETRWSIQPRVSELRQQGKVRPSGDRHINPMGGGSAHVWQRCTAEEEHLILTTGAYSAGFSGATQGDDDDDDD